MALMIRGPTACFASWLAQSAYNEQIDVQKFLKNSNLAVDSAGLYQRSKDRSMALQVERVKSVKDGFEKDPNIIDSKFYLVDSYFVVSEKVKEVASSLATQIRTTTDSIQEVRIVFNSSETGWAPNSQLERDISGVVIRWKNRQTAFVSSVGVIAQIVAMSLASIKANYRMGHPYGYLVLGAMVLSQGWAILSAYRAMELQQIDEIPTLGHWVAQIRRYSYLYGKKYAENRYVQKYLAPSELDHFKVTPRSAESGPSGSLEGSVEEEREKRLKRFKEQKT